MPTALLICMENTFWNISTSRDGNFVKLFKNSFALYVESGREKTVAAIDILIYEVGDHWVSKDFKEKFFKIITEHYLCNFHCFYLHSTLLTPKYSPAWGSCSRVGTKEGSKVYFTAEVDAKNPKETKDVMGLKF